MSFINVDWDTFKNYKDGRHIPIQYVEFEKSYQLRIGDDFFKLETFIKKTDPANLDQTDFETNYKSDSNSSVVDRDSTKRIINSSAIVPKGWSYHSPTFIVTSTVADSFELFNKFGEDLSVVKVGANNTDMLKMKLYDDKIGYESKIESTNRTTARITAIEFTPPYAYYIVDGEITDTTKPNKDFRIYSMLAPHLPYSQGGQREFICCKNLKFGAKNDVKVDGRAPKYVPHIEFAPGVFTNTIEFCFYHDPGFSHQVEITLGLYRE